MDFDVGKIGKEVILNEGTAGFYNLIYIEVLIIKEASNLRLYIDITIYSNNIVLFEWIIFWDNMFLFENGSKRKG